jgi:hypothetical protein
LKVLCSLDVAGDFLGILRLIEEGVVGIADAEGVQTLWCRAANALTMLLSTPPLRNAPTGTSATKRQAHRIVQAVRRGVFLLSTTAGVRLLPRAGRTTAQRGCRSCPP